MRHREAAEKVDRERFYTPLEAAKLAEETSSKTGIVEVATSQRRSRDSRCR